MITHWRYFKYNDLLHTLNVYKILKKEHQKIVQAADEILVSKTLFSKYLEYVPLILRNNKKIRRKKLVRLKVFFYFKCTIRLSANYFKTRHIFKRSRKTPQYNKYSKQFSFFNQKTLKKEICSRISHEKGSNNLLNIIFSQKLGKATYTERKKAECFLIISKIVFFF